MVEVGRAHIMAEEAEEQQPQEVHQDLERQEVRV